MTKSNPLHLRRSIREKYCLDPLNLSASVAAKVLGATRHTLSRVPNGHAAISPDMAIGPEKAGWPSAEFPLCCQST